MRIKFKAHAKVAYPTPGMQWICHCCEEVCGVTWQDIGPYEGREVYMEWRTDCCSSFYSEEIILEEELYGN